MYLKDIILSENIFERFRWGKKRKKGRNLPKVGNELLQFLFSVRSYGNNDYFDEKFVYCKGMELEWLDEFSSQQSVGKLIRCGKRK